MKLFLPLVWLLAMTGPSSAQDIVSGRVDYFGSCQFAAIATSLGYSMGRWMGGHVPIRSEAVVGQLNSLGNHTIFYGPNGNEGRIFIQRTYLDEREAIAFLTEQSCR